ncbi:TBC1 domain family member 10A [Acipenser ruthenus]|uniref:TBC1 domain family member 10A n=1 Tax=Acipenser ruthenus TaxID=7906 RepID=A0A444ULW6_ACIRT|nr:TBC1 domain family member 10A [Acipenser ruthenus]
MKRQPPTARPFLRSRQALILEAIQLDGEILFALLRRVSTVAYKHLKKHKIDPVLYMTEWFMCAFSRTLPWASVLRVWDMFFCEGVKIIFRVGLVLLKNMLGSSDKLKVCQGLYETMELLRTVEPRYMQEGFLMREDDLDLSDLSDDFDLADLYENPAGDSSTDQLKLV